MVPPCHHVPYYMPLAQMHQYHKSSAVASATPPVKEGTTVAEGRRPSRFHVQHPVYRQTQALTVETEYRKYVMGELSSKDTDILQFWEVRVCETQERYDPSLTFTV